MSSRTKVIAQKSNVKLFVGGRPPGLPLNNIDSLTQILRTS